MSEERSTCPPPELRLGDIRHEAPAGPFQLVLCRYLAFTYFDRSLQQRILGRIRECLTRDGALVGRGQS